MIRALILCAGLGTRTGLKKTPKCMQKVNKKPILEHLVNRLNKIGVTEIIINVHKDYDKIFSYFGTRLLYLYEPTLLGEAGTEKLLQDWLGDEYIVMNGDTLTDLDLKEFISDKKSKQFIGLSTGRYGGTTYINKYSSNLIFPYTGKAARYWDCGTPKKLAKARREYK